ncbi:MAG: D-alanyl-D-alanine carboxypeptidase/D-alanyl-D-alanine-endopeptidase, partial [Cyanobacteria bacterium J06600_6]
ETENVPSFSDTPIISLSAPPMREILAEINQASNNLYAEALGKILARRLNLESPTEAIAHYLQKIGIDPKEYVLVDASGLSRQNLIAPQTLVKILQLMARSPNSEIAQAYRQSLARPGASGTLKRRFSNTQIQNNLWGKTGTLTGVGALSGYLNTSSGLPLVFSIIVNNSELKSRNLRSAIDEIVTIVNYLERC